MRSTRTPAPHGPATTGLLLAAVAAIPFASVTIAGRLGSFVAGSSAGAVTSLGAFALGLAGAAVALAAGHLGLRAPENKPWRARRRLPSSYSRRPAAHRADNAHEALLLEDSTCRLRQYLTLNH